MTTAIHHYRSEFDRLLPSLPGQRALWNDWRETAWAAFAEQGFPTIRNEEWKYTSVNALEKLPLSCAPTHAPIPDWDSLKDRVLLPENRHRVVFVNGRFDPALSRLNELPSGVKAGSLSSQLDQNGSHLQSLLTPLLRRTPFAALSAAFLSDGARIVVEAGVQLEEPIFVLYLTTAGNHAAHGVNAYEAATGASVTIVEQYLGLCDEPYLFNGLSRVIVEENARINHVKVQQEGGKSYHIAALETVQKRNSRFESHAFAVSGALGRNDIETALVEPGADATLNGVYCIADRGHQDFHTCIRHESPNCSSRECYKGVLTGTGRAVFNGKVYVAPDAQGTQAEQSNHNLLLSDQAEVDTKPQLEIFADDVKCSHGATVGQLHEEQLFYLRSRGIEAPAARALLIEAFAAEIAGGIEQPAVREAVDHLLRGAIHV
jgi:Fe-S cluster assembly protein SufD